LQEITFDDVTKTISVVAEVVDDNEWNKVLKGAYTGFSIGGKYLRKWADEANKALKRYTASPSEVSLVDIGCNPAATFTLCKADGMEAEVPFENSREGLLQKLRESTDPGEVERLVKALAGNMGILVVETEDELAKGGYSIGRLATLAEDVRCFLDYTGMVYNTDGTMTMKSFGPELKTAATCLYDALLKCVNEDVEAAKLKLKEIKKQLDDDGEEQLRKRADELTIANDTLSKVFVAHGIEEGTEYTSAIETITKAIGDAGELKKSLDTANEELGSVKAELEKVRAEPAPAKGVKSIVVGKEEDGLTKSADSGSVEEGSTNPLAAMRKAQQAPVVIGFGRHTNQSGG
jgi:hypothetical protein